MNQRHGNDQDTGSQPTPTRSIEVTDGQQLSVGDTQLTFTLTPGHTPGTISTLVPVRDGGRSHVAALWGGTAMRQNEEFYTQYIASARTFAAVAAEAGADVVISNHAIFDRADEKIAALASRGAGDPHPFVIGEAATQNMFEMIQLGLTGNQTIEIRERDGTIEIEPAATPMTLEREKGQVVAVPEREMPPLTDNLVRATLDKSRR